MITEKSTIRCESVFNDEHTHRYLWKQVWNKDKPLVGVVMLNPCQSDNLVMDTTTSLVVNNIARLEEYGGVAIVNGAVALGVRAGEGRPGETVVQRGVTC